MRARQIIILLLLPLLLGISPINRLSGTRLVLYDSSASIISDNKLQGSGEESGVTYFAGEKLPEDDSGNSIIALDVRDYEYFGYEITLDDASDSAIDVDVTVAVSIGGSNFTTYTQTRVLYPNNESSAATINITDENTYHGSIQPMPCVYLQIILTNNNADTDVTAEVHISRQ